MKASYESDVPIRVFAVNHQLVLPTMKVKARKPPPLVALVHDRGYAR